VRYTGLVSRFSRINRDAIFIFGNQKSGTTAIAALLSQCTGKSVTLDITREQNWLISRQEIKGKVGLDDFISHFKLEFSRDIIKEPGLTLYFSDLIKKFPYARFVFILRDPRSNIRSILNRHKIDGREISVEPYWNGLGKSWQRIFDGSWAGIPVGNMIESLAHRWNYFAEIYLANSEKLLLVRYEDFKQNKESYIERLAERLGLEARYDISERVDIQFQPKGDHSTSVEFFFGADNLNAIKRICHQNMKKLGYHF
jgi:hypothetical protein